MAVSSSTALGCGRDIDEVWANIDGPPTAHERTCPFCTDARESLRALQTATERLRADDEGDADLQVGPHVLDRILEVARTEVRRSRRLPLSKPLPGEVTSALMVSEQAVAAVVRRTGDLHGGVQVRRCSVELVADAELAPVDGTVPGATEPSDPARASDVRVSLRVSVAADVAIPVLSAELRRAVMDVVRREVGMNVVAVDLVVEDVHGV